MGTDLNLHTRIAALREAEKNRSPYDDPVYLDVCVLHLGPLLEALEDAQKALKRISKMWHDDCGCLVECKIACEVLQKWGVR